MYFCFSFQVVVLPPQFVAMDSPLLPPLSGAEFRALPIAPSAFASRFLHETRALLGRLAARTADGAPDVALAMRAARRVVRLGSARADRC